MRYQTTPALCQFLQFWCASAVPLLPYMCLCSDCHNTPNPLRCRASCRSSTYKPSAWSDASGHSEGVTAQQPVNDIELSAATANDLEAAHDHSADAYHALDGLMGTDLWPDLPLASRRALAAARCHLGALCDALAEVV